jgi:hypothetical protein
MSETTMPDPQPIPTTSTAGIPVESDEHSLTIGPDGPILLHDHYLIEQLAQFNRERVPERQPHAKGSGAFGRFEVTNDVSAFTKAAVFQPGTTTDTVIRFSTVAGERGSPDLPQRRHRPRRASRKRCARGLTHARRGRMTRALPAQLVIFVAGFSIEITLTPAATRKRR